MLKINKKAQAVTELAVFGAVLIYLLGTIVRTAAGNSYTQNQNLKAMRMALLSSWEGSLAGNITHNSASVLIVEDRLSPDINKYGDLDRNPYVASGAGSFTFELLYPLSPGEDVRRNMPIMDVWINGQYFPFITSLYTTETIPSPGDPTARPPFANCPTNEGPYTSYPLTRGQCLQNQCLRNQREWVGGKIWENMFETVVPPKTGETKALRKTDAESEAAAIFLALAGLNPNVGPPAVLTNVQWNGLQSFGYIPPDFSGLLSSSFTAWYTSQLYPTTLSCDTQCQLTNIENILMSNKVGYKLFYSMVANPGVPGTNQTTPEFSPTPPICSSHPCKDAELSSDVPLTDAFGQPTTDGAGNSSNVNGVMQYDLLRNANYASVLTQFPVISTCDNASANNNMRCDVGWQWSATAATSARMIGLNSSNNQYPNIDVDGRLKEQTIYAISFDANSGEPTVSFADGQLGDIDETWDANSCGPKPGLQSAQEIFSFTQAGTYLQIKEGQMYNPESGQVVRSVNKRDTIDLIQRMIQLSNNTGRFCPIKGTPNDTVPLTYIDNDPTDYPNSGPGAKPNPVEVCVDGTGCSSSSNTPSSPSCSCFSTENNIKSTCFDETSNMLYVRSRVQDLRGNFWMTNTSGQLKVQQ